MTIDAFAGQKMKQVMLIQAHKDLEQLNTLVEQLRDDDFIIYVHLDRKSALDPTRLHPAARLVGRRIDVHWVDVSQVEATLNSLREIVAAVPAFDKVVLCPRGGACAASAPSQAVRVYPRRGKAAAARKARLRRR